MEADDALRLLAGLAGIDDYEPPSERAPERIEAMLEAIAPAGVSANPAQRRAEVAAFLLAAGGD